MPCYNPLHGYRSRKKNPSGKYSIVFNQTEGFKDLPVTVPCSQCIGCRLERSRQWAVRCMHEASLHEKNCFVTLTYNPEHYPKNGNLYYEHFQKFMKRLRFENSGSTIRYYMCGEYGEKFKRPHWHACLFGHDFADKITAPMWRPDTKHPLYTSETLSRLWSDKKGQPLGFATIGDVTFESAAYVARYITKKITGESAYEHYTTFDRSTGEILHEREPEFTRMSLKPGIGAEWFAKYNTDIYPNDQIIVRERPTKPPRFYDRLLERINPMQHQKVKNKRKELAKLHGENNTVERLRTRELKKILDTKKLNRSYENET